MKKLLIALLLLIALPAWATGPWITTGFDATPEFESIAVGASSELTIAGGAITVTKSFHTVDTEGDAASDDLTTISGGTPGQVLILMAANAARTVVAKDGATLNLQADFDLDNTGDTLTLMCITAGNWVEITRASND